MLAVASRRDVMEVSSSIPAPCQKLTCTWQLQTSSPLAPFSMMASTRSRQRTAVMFTGRVVALVGVTLAAGVVTWAFSPIKYQADMGILLTFMFVFSTTNT